MSGFSRSTWSVTYKWVIKDWSTKRGYVRLYSDNFFVGGHNW